MNQSTAKKHKQPEMVIYDDAKIIFSGPSYAHKILEVQHLYNSLVPIAENHNSKKLLEIVINQITECIDRSKDAVKEYLQHAEFISETTLNIMVEKEVSRNFFIQAQKPKRRLISDMNHVKSSENEIMEAVSNAVMDFLKEFEKTGRVTNHKDLLPVYFEEETGKFRKGRTVRKLTRPEKKIFKYTKSPLFSINAHIKTENEVGNELKKLLAKFDEELGKRKKYGTKVMINILKVFIKQLIKILFDCKKLQEKNSKKVKRGGKVGG